ncbi:MAG: transposase [Alphaproteobacteria bacterium]
MESLAGILSGCARKLRRHAQSPAWDRRDRGREGSAGNSSAAPAALSEVIRGFKSKSAREINRAAREPRAVWQRGFYEHIIRDDRDLARIREYIDDNPIAWANDPENPERMP